MSRGPSDAQIDDTVPIGDELEPPPRLSAVERGADNHPGGRPLFALTKPLNAGNWGYPDAGSRAHR